jgi:hypothetical protein
MSQQPDNLIPGSIGRPHPDVPEQSDEIMLICNVIFKNGQPILIKAISDAPTDNLLFKAFDIQAYVDKAVREAYARGRQQKALEIGRLESKGK